MAKQRTGRQARLLGVNILTRSRRKVKQIIFHNLEKVPVRRTGAYRHKKSTGSICSIQSSKCSICNAVSSVAFSVQASTYYIDLCSICSIYSPFSVLSVKFWLDDTSHNTPKRSANKISVKYNFSIVTAGRRMNWTQNLFLQQSNKHININIDQS